MQATQFGTFFELGGNAAIEALSRTGLDYVIIDTEHGRFSVESTAEYIIAAERNQMPAYVRIGDISRHSVLRMLDIGAKGLIVPNIRSVEEVKKLVSYAKFPPIGNRGYCPNRTSGWGADEWASDTLAYMQTCNRECKLIPQCETVEALEKIEEIASLDGVDGIFVGPCDLSIAMGIPLQFNHPDLHAAIKKILTACKQHKKESYIFAGNMNDAVMWAEAGFDSITYSLDASVFLQAYRNIVAKFRQETTQL